MCCVLFSHLFCARKLILYSSFFSDGTRAREYPLHDLQKLPFCDPLVTAVVFNALQGVQAKSAVPYC